MSLKSKLFASATLGLAAGALSAPALASDKPASEEKCYGINSCKGTAKCGVSKSDIEVANKAFGEAYASSKTHDCAGHNECGGKDKAGAFGGQLNWTSVPKGTCIKEKKGFLIEEKGGKKTVKKA
jgi:uncharacterized membrane protein